MLSLLFIVPASCAGSDLFRFLNQLIYKGKYDILHFANLCYDVLLIKFLRYKIAKTQYILELSLQL